MKEPRFAVIDLMDCVFFDSNSAGDCFDVLDTFGKYNFRGVYDYEQGCYIDLVDLIDMTGVQIHSNDEEDTQ